MGQSGLATTVRRKLVRLAIRQGARWLWSRRAVRRAAYTVSGLTLAGAALLILRRLNMADFRGRVAMVTGGTRGLGFLISQELARQGCLLSICARDEDELQRARDGLTREGAEVLAERCDVADPVQVDAWVQSTLRRYGRVDVLVNNAGIISVGPVQAMGREDFEAAMGAMYWGTVNPTLSVLPYMQARRSGWIVNITSIGGKVSMPHLLPYSGAKFAAVGFSEGLRAELAGTGVRVITIVPGPLRTGGYVNAIYKGKHRSEFAMFGVGAGLPILTMNAGRAARQIVAAARRGEPERILSIPANLLAKFHGLFPGLTADILGVVNRLFLLRLRSTQRAAVSGMDIQAEIRSPLFDAVTTLGQSAARRNLEYPGPRFVGVSRAAKEAPGTTESEPRVPM